MDNQRYCIVNGQDVVTFAETLGEAEAILQEAWGQELSGRCPECSCPAVQAKSYGYAELDYRVCLNQLCPRSNSPRDASLGF